MTAKKDKTKMRGVDGFGKKIEKKDVPAKAEPSAPPADAVSEAVEKVTGGTDAPVRHVSVSTGDQLLPVRLTDAEIMETGRKVAAAIQRQTELEEEVKNFKDGAKSRESAILAEIGIKSALIRQGYEHRQVECETVKDFDAGTILVRRLDTQEIVETRTMAGGEKQMGFDSIERELNAAAAGIPAEASNELPFRGELATASGEPLITDAQIDEAKRIIAETHRASTSSLQRRMKLGYTMAAKIMDALEVLGIVGPANGAEPRAILAAAEGGEK